MSPEDQAGKYAQACIDAGWDPRRAVLELKEAWKEVISERLKDEEFLWSLVIK